MNLADPFIRRPVMTTLVMAAMLVFGVMAYDRLPVSDLPDVEFPTISVSAELPGASPETMAASVATPLEREFSTIAGVTSMNSSSSQGRTQITLDFELSRRIDDAAADVQAAIARTASRLPAEMPSPPSFRKSNPADQPIIYIALRSATLPMSVVNEYADVMMGQRLSTISGVAQVNIFGSQKYAVRIKLDPHQLTSRGIGLDEVARAVSQANVNLPTGMLGGAVTNYTIETTGQLDKASEYRSLIVAWRGGKPVRLADLGQVLDGVENEKTAAWVDGVRSITVAVQKQPGVNTVQVVEKIRELLPTFRSQLPAAIDMVVTYDRSQPIRESVHDVKFTLVLTLALVVLTMFIFLRNVRATLIPSLAIPMSLVGTFAVMYLLDFSLDNLSLMALTLSIGFVVDDAIVVLENIVRHMERGEDRREATFKGTREVGFTIVSMTISLAAVFLPVMFMGGLVGRLLNEFAVTIGAAILISGFVSLSLTPMLCSRFLRPPPLRHGPFHRAIEWLFEGMLASYEWTLRLTLRAKALTMLASAVVLALTVHYFNEIPKGFLPNEDAGRILAGTEAAEGIGFDALVDLHHRASALLADEPAVQSMLVNAGARGNLGSANGGFLFITLKPRDQRGESVDQMIQRLRPKMASIPGLNVFLNNPPPIRLGGSGARNPYQFVLRSSDTRELFRQSAVLLDKLRDIPGVQDPTSDLLLRNPQVRVDIDRDKASSLGIPVERIEQALGFAYGTRRVSTIYGVNDEYDVIMEIDPRHQQTPDALLLIHVRTDQGSMVPLESFARIERSVGPMQITHFGQLPSVTLSFNLKPGHALGDAVDEINRIAAETLPPTISTQFQGAAAVFQDSLKGLGLLLIVTIAVIYIVLGILYESFIHPLTILTGLPFAGFGALATLMYFGMDLNLYAFVGVIMLVGLVKKNSIMIVDFAIDAQRSGQADPAKAVYDACVVRFRPIMMTTFAALLGTLPIAMGLGAGAESRRPLGLAVVGGLLFSQVLTLYVTPVFYLYMESLQRLLRRSRAPVIAANATADPSAASPLADIRRV